VKNIWPNTRRGDTGAPEGTVNCTVYTMSQTSWRILKIRKLRWASHIIRMEEERIPKKVLNGNFYTTRPVGRPRTRWADVVQRDALQLLGIRGWRRRAENRDEWRRLLREAKAQKGL